MTFNEYQEQASRTAINDVRVSFRRLLLAVGLVGEAGEVADLVKKEAGHGHTFETAIMGRELGDVLWYVAVLAKEYGLSLEQVAQMNVVKLQKRYPEGFTVEDSVNRSDK